MKENFNFYKFVLNNKIYIEKCVLDGKYCSYYAHKETWEDYIIYSISEYDNKSYNSCYGDDVYFNVCIYHGKGDKDCFENGFKYTTNRIVKLSEVIKYMRKYKLIKINERRSNR